LHKVVSETQSDKLTECGEERNTLLWAPGENTSVQLWVIFWIVKLEYEMTNHSSKATPRITADRGISDCKFEIFQIHFELYQMRKYSTSW